MSGARLPAPWGLHLDRSRSLSFRFEGRLYEGLAGDTLASALAANGVDVLSRSFKYHRPRGLLGARGLDSNAYVQLGDEPNVPADRLPLREGLSAHGQNYRGSLEKDRDHRLEKLAPFLPVGFYYKAFYKPNGSWRWWEPLFRARAGLGRLYQGSQAGYHDKAYLFADVAVVGGGPAGLAAAEAASAGGAEVVLVDDEPRPGGSLLYTRTPDGPARADSMLRTLRERSVRILSDADLHRPLRRQLAGGRPGQPPLQAPRACRRARHRLGRAADGVPQQRPARHHPRLRGAKAPAAMGRPPRPPRRRGHRQRPGLRRRPRPAGRRNNRRPSARSPTEPCGRRPPSGAELARSSRLDRRRGRAGPGRAAAGGRADRPAHRPGPDGGRARGDRLRSPRHLGRLHAPWTARLPRWRPPRPRTRAGELPSRQPPARHASRRLGQPGLRARSA